MLISDTKICEIDNNHLIIIDTQLLARMPDNKKTAEMLLNRQEIKKLFNYIMKEKPLWLQ